MTFFIATKPQSRKLPVHYSRLSMSERREVREQYIREQQGLCYHCEVPLNEEPSNEVAVLDVSPDLFPEGFFKHPIHLHHDHDTDMTIGAVHAHCNAVLWEYEGK